MELSLEEKMQKLKLLEEKKKLREGLPHLYGQKFYKWMRAYFESSNKISLLFAANQIGKLLPLDVLIPTPSGFVRNGDLAVGQEVFGSDGKVTKVLAISEEQDVELYKITFDDGESVVACSEHQWIAKGYGERFRREYRSGDRVWANPDYDKWKTYTTKEILTQGKYSPEAKPASRFTIPLTSPVEYLEKELFDPYILGLLIGDGALGRRTLCNSEKEISDYVVSKLDATVVGKNINIRGIIPKLKELGLNNKLSAEKFIPEEYKLGSIEQRKNLLAGLLDTDGSIYGKGQIEYCTVSEVLHRDVIELVNSLGGKCKTRVKRDAGYKKDGVFHPCQDAYRVFINLPFNPFKLKRKADRFYIKEACFERVIYSIEKVDNGKGKCIKVDNKDSSYLCTKNYIVTHNSSSQIRKCIHWATDSELWPKLWKTRPRMFWYFYPDSVTAQAELEHKWIPEFLPKNAYKDTGKYGYTIEDLGKKNKFPAIHFNSGVSVYFKGYSKSVVNIQSSTLHAIYADEELPKDYFDEIMFRLTATDGYFSMVCTPTLGQQFWRDAIEPSSKDTERFKDAFKLQVSMYDCLEYEDGSETPWTLERIKKIEDRCSSALEVEKRVHGKFIKEGGLKYGSFDPNLNLCAPYDITDWYRYAGIDIGSGGDRHPSSIVFVAVRPDFKKMAVYKGWRGDGVLTTSSDVLEKFRLLRGNEKLVQQTYDYHARDFFLVASRLGEPFTPADKSQALGTDMINTLFRNKMLDIFDLPAHVGLVNELLSLQEETPKKDAKDDFIDGMRYAITKIPVDWTAGGDDVFEKDKQEIKYNKDSKDRSKTEIDLRREMFFGDQKEESLEDVVEEWNSYYES